MPPRRALQILGNMRVVERSGGAKSDKSRFWEEIYCSDIRVSHCHVIHTSINFPARLRLSLVALDCAECYQFVSATRVVV